MQALSLNQWATITDPNFSSMHKVILGKVFGLVYPIGMCFQLLMSRKWSALRRKRQIAVVADGATFIARSL